MAITIPPISELPLPPTKADPNNFAARADDFLGALPEFQVELNTSITQMNRITSGLDQATPIVAWAVGTTYDFPDVVAGSDGYSYRCIDTGVVGVDPVTDSGTYWVNLSSTRSPIPVGTVVAFIGGYFSDTANSGFVSVIGNTAATLNSVLNPDGWYVCNGAAVNSSDSSIFNGASRFLPNISDSRFLLGSSTAGTTGGSNSFPISSVDGWAITTSQMPSHSHSGSTGSGGAHTHALNGGVTMSGSTLGSGGTRGDRTGVAESAGSHTHSLSIGSTGGGAVHSHTITSLADSNMPKFLSCFYIMKVF